MALYRPELLRRNDLVPKVTPRLSNHTFHKTRRKVSTTTASLNNGVRSEPPSYRRIPSLETVKVPHCGYHFDNVPRRFFEGWYWKVQIPSTSHSFALIYSIEDPEGSNPHSGVGVQVMGPADGYICQFNSNTNSFWADRNNLALGAVLTPGDHYRLPEVNGNLKRGSNGGVARCMLSPDRFFDQVMHGFQASYTRQTGRIVAREEGTAGRAVSTVKACSWDISIQPCSGWGENGNQKATAGWLSILSIFEPHWQVLMADGLASGWLDWGGERYQFKDAPAYAEKNWGGGFPSKWCWVQCNSFDNQPGLSLTAVGARRALALGLPGIEEDVGLIGVHLPGSNGQFIELVPWKGSVDWDVDPWGRWRIHAINDEYEALVEASCSEDAGMVLRAPTFTQGLAPFCKDTFYGRCRLRIWRLRGKAHGWKGVGNGEIPLIDATSTTAALEVGGGPWWTPWVAEAAMKEPFRSLVQLPVDVGLLGNMVPGPLKPPGL
ncbi:hypothetical protein CEUSTIGMA_g2033.t1 [Chlamydomonas eustigma]|uniref:Tocopherol cyclase n=1 Tax=Chlamydomonas eustigma TaxID=1157962 RepID=A0A250WUW0_9CHLO|nr:hypothetical protein CEUSTIGMA_g2033.t1 [Chlamydomonas eustigma]|eukprot:GAX74585.1 hypothetical protein CEUSTIGMA_g2033.t1 [Chlamydomonas eustigma]